MTEAGLPTVAIYLAAPLFSQAERIWNRTLTATIADLIPEIRFILPQTFSAEGEDAHGSLHEQCVAGVREADIIVAVLDGPDADCGVAWEMGYASAMGKPVIGIRTDMRASQEQGVNLMISRGCAALVRTEALDDDVPSLARRVAKTIEQLK